MLELGRGVKSAAIASALLLLPAAIPLDIASAVAPCTTTQNSYVGNGTNGTNGVGYTTYSVTQTGSCLWSVPAGITQADVLIVGGGGGGAGGNSGASGSGGGGGGGGAMVATNYPLTPTAGLSLTIGTGGTGGASASTNRDTTLGTQGGNTIFDQISAGGGGGGGYSSTAGYATEVGKAGTAGGGGGGSSNHWYAYNDGVSGGTRAAGGTGTSVTIGGQTYSGITGGLGGIYVLGQSGGNTGGSGGGAASGATGNATNGASPAPGAGLTTYISGTQTSYGGGGLAYGATSWTAGGTPTGVGFGGWGGEVTVGGSNGNSGLVLIRILTPALTFSSFNLSGNATTANYRANTSIAINVSAAAKVTFLAGNKKIPGCVKVSTSGTSPNIIATCTWRPSVHGLLSLSAVVYPTGGGSNISAGPLRIGVPVRTGNR